MKTIGIIGGMSPESTTLYYQTINRAINQRLGGNSSAEIIMHSVNFETVVQLQKQGDWAAAGHLLANSATKLAGAGADLLLLATNTMHKVAPRHRTSRQHSAAAYCGCHRRSYQTARLAHRRTARHTLHHE